jgi:hypothetical protein
MIRGGLSENLEDHPLLVWCALPKRSPETWRRLG